MISSLLHKYNVIILNNNINITINNFYSRELNLNAENYFISQFKNKHIGDDGALLDGYVYSKDAFFENVHFKTKWMNHYQIARKSMLVNISDAIAMNARPKYALLSVAMPKDITKKHMKELHDGFVSAAKEYNVEVIGGDTIANIKLDITITIISVANKKPLLRTGIRKNDLIAYTGDLGKSSRDLRYLLNGGKLNKHSKFIDLKLKNAFVKKSIRFLHSGMDISDGLLSDLGKLSDANRVGFNFSKKINKQIGCSGEEYEMLVSFDKRHKKAILRLAKSSRTKITIIASIDRQKYTQRCKSHHF